jgi:siroheme synthase-like protein
MSGFPIILDLTGRTALVVGLGTVGRRKAGGLLAAGARVLGVDPRGGDKTSLAGAEIRAEAYRPEHLEGASLVFAAATPEVNAKVLSDARSRGIWANSATDPAEGDFAVPAVWQDGALLVAVSTQGASPALAAALRDRAAQALGPAAAGLASLLSELRPLAFARILDPSARHRLLIDWGDPQRLSLWESEGKEAVRKDLLESLESIVCSLPNRDDERTSLDGNGDDLIIFE